jgi:hypothetical protein
MLPNGPPSPPVHGHFCRIVEDKRSTPLKALHAMAALADCRAQQKTKITPIFVRARAST